MGVKGPGLTGAQGPPLLSLVAKYSSPGSHARAVGPELTGARGLPLLDLKRHSSPGPRAGAIGGCTTKKTPNHPKFFFYL